MNIKLEYSYNNDEGEMINSKQLHGPLTLEQVKLIEEFIQNQVWGELKKKED